MSVEPIPFKQLRRFFADEHEYGQLCDIVAPEADRQDWAVFLAQTVPRYPYRFAMLTGDRRDEQSIPSDPLAVLLLAGSEEGPWPDLQIEVDGLDIRVHFFGPDYLELDALRRDISEERYRALTNLMAQMGDAMRHDVFMTPESAGSEAAIVYEAAAHRFRRPKHGLGADGILKARVMSELREVLRPFLVPRADRRDELNPPDESLKAVVDCIERIWAEISELRLQDELTIEERQTLDRSWSFSKTIVCPPAGTAPVREDYIRCLSDLARQLR